MSFSDLATFDTSLATDYSPGQTTVETPSSLFEPSHDILGTAVGRELETPSRWNAAPYTSSTHDSAPLASSLANREIQRSGRSWSQMLADTRRDAHRGLPRRRSRYRSGRSDAQTTPAIAIPESLEDRYDPLKRWQNSPPEDDHVSMAAVEQALKDAEHEQTRPYQTDYPVDAKYPGRGRRSRPGSITSNESAASSPSIRSSNSAASSVSTRSRSTRRKPQRTRKPKVHSDQSHIFKCTFCCDTFYKRYDWTRHEKSLHLNLDSWVCCPQGGSVYSPATGRRHCAYCNLLDPSIEHLDSHDHSSCSKGARRQFNRKDHLVQHLRLYHRLQTLPLIDDWKVPGPNIVSRCGFCDQRMPNWEERVDHLAAHFRAGRTMKDWKGDHDFEPHVKVKVTNSIPPYLIGEESETMVPFSSTSQDVRDHVGQISARMNANIIPSELPAPLPSPHDPEIPESDVLTFPESLVVHLSRYGRHQLNMGITPTDDMFQREARRLVYDSDDPWNQCIVDNAEWLAAFRLLHGWNNPETSHT